MELTRVQQILALQFMLIAALTVSYFGGSPRWLHDILLLGSTVTSVFMVRELRKDEER